jgi:hypothetical protein
MAHRGTLNANFTTDLQRKVVEKAEGKPESVMGESLRIVEDALSCAESVDFMGPRSAPYVNPRENATGSFCSMPVKLSFQDRRRLEELIGEDGIARIRAGEGYPGMRTAIAEDGTWIYYVLGQDGEG